MLNKKAVSPVFGSLMMALVIIGCSDNSGFVDDLKIDSNPLERVSRVKGEVKPGKDMLIAEMSPDDAIVLINGYPLTKRIYDEAVMLYAQSLDGQKDVNNLVADKYLEQFKEGYVRRFVGQRLLIDEAFRQGLVTTNEVCAFVHRKVVEAAEKSKKPASKVGNELKGSKAALYYDLAANFVMDKPKAKVNDEFVAATKKAIEADIAESTKQNERIRERLASWRAQIISNRVDFAAVAKQYSQDENTSVTNAPGGYWGEFTESEMDDAKVAAAVFALQKNAISGVIEDENGLHLVKVLDVTPAVKDENDKVVKDEVRKLSHIYIEKCPVLMRESEPVLRNDLKYQMQLQAVNAYTAGLMTNGTHTVVYPHGTNFFPNAMQMIKRGGT